MRRLLKHSIWPTKLRKSRRISWCFFLCTWPIGGVVPAPNMVNTAHSLNMVVYCGHTLKSSSRHVLQLPIQKGIWLEDWVSYRNSFNSFVDVPGSVACFFSRLFPLSRSNRSIDSIGFLPCLIRAVGGLPTRRKLLLSSLRNGDSLLGI